MEPGEADGLASPLGWVERWRAGLGADRIAISFEGQDLTYGALAARIDLTAAGLAERGVRAGDRVAWLGLNRIELFETLFACAELGAMFLPLNNRFTPSELARQLNAAEPRLVLSTDGFAPTAAEAIDRGGLALRTFDLDAQPIRADSPESLGREANPAAAMLMVFTSGTTGTAKGALLSQSAMHYTAACGASAQGLGPTDTIIAPLPTFHVGGINVQTMPALFAGARVVLTRSFDPGQVLDLIEVHRPTQALLVPAMLSAVAAHPRFGAVDLGCFEGVMTGSSTVPEAVTAPWFDRGVAIGQVYGATETGPTVVVLGYDDAAHHPGSCGQVVPGHQVRIAAADGSLAPIGEPGEVQVRGPNLLSEYWRDPEATQAAFVDGWYRTGDVGHLDADGYLTVADRLDDMVISGGENVYPAEVEAALVDHPGIAEIAVIGLPDERLGEMVVAIIVAADPADPPTVESLRNWATDRLARFKHPRDVIVVEDLPRTALGKVTKHVLRTLCN